MGENPGLFAELLLQISIEEGEKHDKAYRSWKAGLNQSFGEYEAVPRPVPKATQLSPRAALPTEDEPADSRIIGEDARRRVLHEEVLANRPDPRGDTESERSEDYEFADFLRST
jgi:hypothetical protein